MSETALKISAINKPFGGISVLRNVSFEVYAGEVHALVGENGAGKSVLMKTLMGAHQPDSGDYILGNKRVRFSSPAEAQRQHVSMVYQEFGLVPFLSVAENIFMGRVPVRRGKLVDWPKVYEESNELLGVLGANISPRTMVAELKLADQQEVEITRALSYEPTVFIMDEPTAALSTDEIQHLYELVKILRNKGVAIIYITHKLGEVFDIADRVTIIRDGVIVATHNTSNLDVSTLMEKMTGKQISAAEVHQDASEYFKSSKDILKLQDLKVESLFSNINLTAGKGEVVGVAGLVGAGKTELGKAIFGALPKPKPVTGKYIFNGEEVDTKSLTPSKAKKMGIGFVTEDRLREGVIPEQSMLFNITLPAFHKVTKKFVLLATASLNLVRGIIKAVALRPPEPNRLVKFLSGGNQQKVVIGKWLAAEVQLLILDEPTRGVDIGAREEIYDVIRQQARQGIGILLLSSDLREILKISDRILVMRLGRITTELLPHQTSEENLLQLILGKETTNAN